MTTYTESSERLGVAHLMLVTTGIAVAFFVGRGLGHLRFSADSFFHNAKEVSGFDVFGMLVAAIYGLSVSILLIAIRSKNMWSSPGKTMALLFATMCLLNWGLEFIAAAIMNVRMRTPVPGGMDDNRGFILGVWYRDFPVEIGYVVGLPVLVWVLVRSRDQSRNWRLAWFGFLVFALLIVAFVYLGLRDHLPPVIRSWYFEFSIGIPMVLLINAVAFDLVHRKPLDWWTTLTVVPVVCVWCLGLTMKMMA